MGFPGGSGGKESACNAGDLCLIPGLGRYPGEGNCCPLQYSYLGNLMDKGVWWVIVHGAAEESDTNNNNKSYPHLQISCVEILTFYMSFPSGSTGKESACNAGDLVSIPGLGRSPGEGNGYPCQYSGLENSMDCIAHGFSKSWTQLNDFLFHPLYDGTGMWGQWEMIRSWGWNPYEW